MNMNPAAFLKNALAKVRNAFRPLNPFAGFHAPQGDPEEIGLHLQLKAPGGSRRAGEVERWCKGFNDRNGRVVPEVSPESIYRKAMKPRRRKHA